MQTRAQAIKSSFRIALFVGLTLNSVAVWPQTPDGRRLYEARCIPCHELPDVEEAATNGLLKSFHRMAELARLDPDQHDSVLEFLLSHTEQSVNIAALEEDRVFFEEKCSHCHSLQRIFLEPLTDESRHHVVSRMQVRSGTDWLSDQDVERVLNYLAVPRPEIRPPEPSSADASAHDIFETRCMACHSLERIFTEPINGDEVESEWAHIVSRMRGRAPQWITDAEAQQILEYLQSLPVLTPSE